MDHLTMGRVSPFYKTTVFLSNSKGFSTKRRCAGRVVGSLGTQPGMAIAPDAGSRRDSRLNPSQMDLIHTSNNKFIKVDLCLSVYSSTILPYPAGRTTPRSVHSANPASGFRHHSTHLLCKPDMGAAHEHSISRNTNINKKQYVCPLNENHTAEDSVSPRPDSYLVSLGQGNFSDFLKALHKPATRDLLIQCNSFMQRILDAKSLTMDEKAEAVQSFYKEIGRHIPDDMSEEKDQLLDNIEKLLMTRLYKSVFCPDGSLEEQKDLLLQNRIKSMSWVTPKMLQFSLSEHNQDVKDRIASAVVALVEMDSKRAPQDKVACVSKACNHLFGAIEVSSKEPATTDDLISGLVYITLKANPPRLFSNQQYITRFCNPKRLMTGRSAYWFTNFCSASSYIETMNFSSLGLTEEEFKCLMQQTKPEHCAFNGSIRGTVQQTQENKQQLLDLQYRQKILLQKAEGLLREIQAWPILLQREVQEILHKYPLHTKPSAS